jgi:hypothetical protein
MSRVVAPDQISTLCRGQLARHRISRTSYLLPEIYSNDHFCGGCAHPEGWALEGATGCGDCGAPHDQHAGTELMLPRHTFCVECGPDVSIDEDGCCLSCGNGAVGSWLDKHPSIKRMLVVVEAARGVRHAWLSMHALNTYQRQTRAELDQAIEYLDTPCGCIEACPQLDPDKTSHRPGCPHGENAR